MFMSQISISFPNFNHTNLAKRFGVNHILTQSLILFF